MNVMLAGRPRWLAGGFRAAHFTLCSYGQCHLAYVDHAAAVVNLAIVMVGG